MGNALALRNKSLVTQLKMSPVTKMLQTKQGNAVCSKSNRRHVLSPNINLSKLAKTKPLFV